MEMEPRRTLNVHVGVPKRKRDATPHAKTDDDITARLEQTSGFSTVGSWISRTNNLMKNCITCKNDSNRCQVCEDRAAFTKRCEVLRRQRRVLLQRGRASKLVGSFVSTEASSPAWALDKHLGEKTAWDLATTKLGKDLVDDVKRSGGIPVIQTPGTCVYLPPGHWHWVWTMQGRIFETKGKRSPQRNVAVTVVTWHTPRDIREETFKRIQQGLIREEQLLCPGGPPLSVSLDNLRTVGLLPPTSGSGPPLNPMATRTAMVKGLMDVGAQWTKEAAHVRVEPVIGSAHPCAWHEEGYSLNDEDGGQFCPLVKEIALAHPVNAWLGKDTLDCPKTGNETEEAWVNATKQFWERRLGTENQMEHEEFAAKMKASSGVGNKQLNVDPAVSMFEANSDRDRDVTKAHAHWQGDTLG